MALITFDRCHVISRDQGPGNRDHGVRVICRGAHYTGYPVQRGHRWPRCWPLRPLPVPPVGRRPACSRTGGQRHHGGRPGGTVLTRPTARTLLAGADHNNRSLFRVLVSTPIAASGDARGQVAVPSQRGQALVRFR